MALTTVVVSAVAALGLTACKKQTDNKNAEIYAIYTEYVAYAESNGEKPLSYEEWLSTIKGEKGDKGDKGDKGEKGENGKDGEKGEKGEKGENGKDGHTPIITIGENGNWFIDGVDTKVKAQGEQGEKGESGNDGINGSDGKNGESGKSAYEIYKEKYGYEGTEEEWLDDLVNGRLALKDKYTVTFDSDGGSEVESQEVTAGKKANEPDIPTKTGYTFGGWFVKTTEWNFLAYTVIENVTLKAKWIANEYTLKFNSDGGNEIADMTVTYDGDYTLPKLTKENYVFLGWKEGEIVYAQSGKWKKTSGATLTAEWVIAKSTITFETNGGSIVAPMTINYGEDYTLPTSTRENYALVGWFLDEKKFEGGTPLTGDITLSAKWQGVTDTFEYTEENGEITLAKFKGGVTDVIIPANINDVAVTKLADGIFRDNTEITSVTFDGSFENYDAKLFQGCTSLRSLVISGVYDKELYYLFGGSINDIPESFIEITFAKNSNYVDGTMFKNKVANHIVTYVIPDGTTKIRGFNGWRYMKAVHIPDSATSIGTSAFEGCSGLTSISIPNGVTSIGMYAFRYCSSLTSISIPNGVTRIGDSTFSGCSSLTSIFLPDSITEIWDWAFSSCKSLTSINIPQNVKYVRSEAFENCDRLVEKSKGLYYVDTWIIGVVDSSITTAVIKDTTRGIASSAGSEFYGITNVYITDLAAWCNIAGLENIMCGGWNSESKKYDSHMKIYLNNKLVTDLTIPDGVTNIASYAFYNCELTSVTIPDSVTSVGDRAFV